MSSASDDSCDGDLTEIQSDYSSDGDPAEIQPGKVVVVCDPETRELVGVFDTQLKAIIASTDYNRTYYPDLKTSGHSIRMINFPCVGSKTTWEQYKKILQDWKAEQD